MTQLLNKELITGLRHESGLSLNELAKRMATSSPVLRALEAGTNHEALTLRFIRLLAAALGVAPQALFATEPVETPRSPTTDDVRVEALLGALDHATPPDDLASALGWDLKRTHRSLRALAARLKGTGLQLTRTHDGYRIRARREVVGSSRVKAARRRRLSLKGLRIEQARLIDDARRDQLGKSRSASRDLMLGSLVNVGIVAMTDDGYALTPEVEFGLAFGADAE